AGHVGLAAEFSFNAYFASHGGYLVGEGGERVDHAVDGVGEGGDFAFGIHGQLALQIAHGDGCHDFCDAAHLVRPVPGHEVHVSLAASFSFGAYFSCHAGYFGCERSQLVHHGVDGVFEFQNFAAHVHRNLLGQVAVCDGGGYGGDVTHLVCQVACHEVHGVGQ